MKIDTFNIDYLIVGSGAAGLYAAWNASKYGSVALVTKTNLSESSSYWAQGGVAAVIQSDDSFEEHIYDTFKAGREAGNLEAIQILVEEGSKDVQQLIKLGMAFDKSGESFELALEGGHSKRRILHANGAATGKALINFLSELVQKTDGIEVIENAFVYNLISGQSKNRCLGADIYLNQQKKQLRILSKAVLLATGGYSGLYGRSTNPHTSTGDGLWLGLQLGAILKDLEFIQFHPTAYYSKEGASFLISEALRGEGARLYNRSGERFMNAYGQKELAPRDVVAKEIHQQIESSDDDFVYLDLRHLDQDRIKERFTELISAIEKTGINISEESIPVAPAAHYCIGGIETDLHGLTSVDGLYACGEVATTGVHGANRLASNSLLECLVFGRRAAVHAAENSWNLGLEDDLRPPNEPLIVDHQQEKIYTAIKSEISELLNRNAGILRSKTGLTQAINRIGSMKEKIQPGGQRLEYYDLRTKGLLDISERILKGALERGESIGVHNRIDENSTEMVID